MDYFPVFMNLQNQPVLVIGGGEVACRKVDMLLRSGAMVTIVAPKLHNHLASLVDQGAVKWLNTPYHTYLLMTDSFKQVWATTNNSKLNAQIRNDAHQAEIPINVVDNTDLCDFITPSMVNRGRIQIAISSGGGSPVLIRYLRERIESVLPQNLMIMADFATSKRNDVKLRLPSVDLRRKFWELFFSSPELKDTQSVDIFERVYQQLLNARVVNNEFLSGSLIGIEFGQDVEMLSIKALRLMQQSELVLYPTNCPFDFIDLCRRDADRQQYNCNIELAELLQSAQAENKRICILIDRIDINYLDLDFKYSPNAQGEKCIIAKEKAVDEIDAVQAVRTLIGEKNIISIAKGLKD